MNLKLDHCEVTGNLEWVTSEMQGLQFLALEFSALLSLWLHPVTKCWTNNHNFLIQAPTEAFLNCWKDNSNLYSFLLHEYFQFDLFLSQILPWSAAPVQPQLNLILLCLSSIWCLPRHPLISNLSHISRIQHTPNKNITKSCINQCFSTKTNVSLKSNLTLFTTQASK